MLMSSLMKRVMAVLVSVSFVTTYSLPAYGCLVAS